MARRRKKDNPVARLAFVLLRYFRGWWDKARIVEATGFLNSQVTMWDHGDRPVPWHALQKTADATRFPRYLLRPMLRVLRSFLQAAQGRSLPRRALTDVSVTELLPLAAATLDLILEPLEEPDEEQASPEALLERLKKRTESQRRLLVEKVPEFRHPGLVPLLHEESRRLEAKEWAELAERLERLVDERA